MIELDNIITDWVAGYNIQEGLNFIYQNANQINKDVMELLYNDNPSEKDILNMYNILAISNILYNNTSGENLVLEDGVYDLLVVKYKSITGKDVVGAPPVHFPDNIQYNTFKQELIPGVIYLSEDDCEYIDNMLYHDDLYRNKMFTPEDLLVPGVTYDKIVSKRLKDTAHSNPELVGTLDKCKFVLMKQAIDKGVEEDPLVNVLERDFFGKHIQAGIINPRNIIDVIVELKYDGVSVEADILNQRIVSACTRGDTANDLASDLTPILEGYYFPNAPTLNEVIGVKFEAIMTHDNLETYSRLKGRKFANCRTAIISWITSADAYQYRELVTLVPLATNLKDEYGKPIDRLVEVEFMNRYLCRSELLRYSVFSGDLTNVLFQIYKFAEEAEFMRKVLPFMYDGIVVSYLDPKIRETLGRKNAVNLYSMAVKFNSLVRETRFVEYKYTVGQNGEITPMIYYNPVEFFGTIHPKSSGHSYGRFKELSLRPGDIIEVEYKNDVMPYVYKKDCVDNDNNTNPVVEFPKECPFCGTPLVFTDASARCPNFNCPEVVVKRMTSMLDKLQFSGFAEETVRALNLKSFTQLMELRLENISYIGDLTSKSLIEQINKLKNSNILDWRLVGALGFTNMAANTWKLIFSKITLIDLMNSFLVDEEKEKVINMLSQVNGIGPNTIQTLLSEYNYFINDLIYIISMMDFKDSIGTKLIKVRFTGVRDKNLVDKLNSMGYDAGEGGVTKDTDILVVPSADYKTGSKYKKAVEYGVKIIPIQDLIDQINNL